MSASHSRATETSTHAAAPVRRLKGNPLRRHWLSAALFVALVGVISFTGLQVYQAEQRLEHVRQVRAEAESELREAQLRHDRLQETLKQVTSDESMELLAKKMGFTKENEQIYQTGSPKGN